MKIVVAIDGSRHGDRALAWAAREADLRAASLTALHAIRVNRLTGPLGRETAHDREHAAAVELIHDALERVGVVQRDVGVEVPLVSSRGAAGAVLHNTRDADLVVLGSRGLGGFPGLLLGSVSQQVAAHARVPVAIIPAADGTTPVEIRSVVVGVDGSTASRRALSWAADEARARAIRLDAVHVRPPVGHMVPDTAAVDTDVLEQRVQHEATARLAAIVDEELGPRHDAVRRPVVARPPASVLMQDAATPSSLLVVGSRGRGGFTGLLLGSVSQQCITHARGPVVVVHAS
jgi:nucleotide-binding universal stress UspA family protein